MHTEFMTYADGDQELEGYLAAPTGAADGTPVVLVAHAWGGQDDFARAKAEALAELGYLGFAIDVYGAGRRGGSPEVNAALMQPFVEDRSLLRRRLAAAVHEARRLPAADPHRVAAIGFCFGGLCALDMARANLEGVRGVVSFHGLLGAPPSDAGFPADPVRPKVLALHGYDDPMAPPDALLSFADEMTARRADWQVVAYGGTMHAFTNPAANAPDNGLLYSPAADCRSWGAMRLFLEESLAA